MTDLPHTPPPEALDTPAAVPLAAAAPQGDTRLGVYVLLGASAGSVPLPWVPEALLRRVRGALLHDVATRHGVSLTPEARAILCDPLGVGAPRGVVADALRFVGGKVAMRALTLLGPASLVWPVGGALRTYVLGHLFEHYLAVARTDRAVRVDAAEARRVRAAIDAAFARVVTMSARAPEPEPEPGGSIDDQRDATTALIDAILGFTARVPTLITRRLDAAFDETLASHAHP
jgi:hypothetical protein